MTMYKIARKTYFLRTSEILVAKRRTINGHALIIDCATLYPELSRLASEELSVGTSFVMLLTLLKLTYSTLAVLNCDQLLY